MKILEQRTNGNYNKLTITNNEARVKLSNKLSEKQNRRTLDFATDIVSKIDKNLLVKTLRGNFSYDDGRMSIKLKYNHREGGCIASFHREIENVE